MLKDDMGNPDNLTLKTLAKAALAGNDGDANSFLAETKKALEKVSTEDLQAEIDKIGSPWTKVQWSFLLYLTERTL